MSGTVIVRPSTAGSSPRYAGHANAEEAPAGQTDRQCLCRTAAPDGPPGEAAVDLGPGEVHAMVVVPERRRRLIERVVVVLQALVDHSPVSAPTVRSHSRVRAPVVSHVPVVPAVPSAPGRIRSVG